MKHTILFAFIIFSLQAIAQPQAINYQGVARNSQGLPLVNHSIGLRLSILDSSNIGQVVYVETQNPTTNNSGLFNISIGLGNILSGNFSSIPWGQGDKWLKVELDTSGGSNYHLLGTTQFLSVPYSIYSANGNWTKSGNNITNSNSGNVNVSGSLSIGTVSPSTPAQLDVTSNSKGFLPPRMTFSQRNAIINPVAGLIVWCTNCNISGELQVFNGTVWTNIIGGDASAILPTLTTLAMNNIFGSRANTGGNITSDGGAPILARGVCWSTTPNPTISLSTKTIDGTGSGIFSSNITGLNVLTTYYVRAYATNIDGTSYGAEINFTTTQIGIGSPYQGGIIAYVDTTGLHGFIVAPTDQSGGLRWYNGINIVTGATGTAIGTGNSNTNTIVAIQGNGSYAAKLCYDLVLNGYSDWYLPSHDEMDILYTNVGFGATGANHNIAGFNYTYYWSSTEAANNCAWGVDLSSGSWNSCILKMYPYLVRAIRTF